MPVFKDDAELVLCLGTLFSDAARDGRVAPRIRDSGLIIRFRYEEPHGTVTFNAAAPPTQPGAYLDVIWGDDVPLKPDVELSMKADVAHNFWHGKVNLMVALTQRKIIAKGPVPKILKLLPAVEPLYEMYPRILRQLGREDLIVK